MRAIGERFVGFLRQESLHHGPTALGLILSEGTLRRAVKEHLRGFNYTWPHQDIEQSIPCPCEWLPHNSKLVLPPVRGALHHDYHRQAA